MSVNDLLKEEAQRQIDLAIESIPVDASGVSTLVAKSRFRYKYVTDFLLGYEYGYIMGACTKYFKEQAEQSGKVMSDEEKRQVINDFRSVIYDRLPEIRRAIQRAVT